MIIMTPLESGESMWRWTREAPEENPPNVTLVGSPPY